MTPITREEIYLAKLAGESVTVPSPVSRKEMYLAKACGETVTVPDPVSREEMYLSNLAGESVTVPSPVSRLELLMAAACGEAVTPYDPVSRLEWFWMQLVSPTHTIIGVPPIAFTSDGTALSSWIIYGNGSQTGTPTPDAPIQPQFVGTLSGADWTIPITCAGQTVPVYLGQTQAVRKIRKLVLTGGESVGGSRANGFSIFATGAEDAATFCTHFAFQNISAWDDLQNGCISNAISRYFRIKYAVCEDATAFKSYLAAQYANGTPVTVWYVLEEPTTGIINDPLCKIGTYADELRSTDAGVTIPTVSGSNILTIGTNLQPSSVSIAGHISQ